MEVSAASPPQEASAAPAGRRTEAVGQGASSPRQEEQGKPSPVGAPSGERRAAERHSQGLRKSAGRA
eukprot:8870603-Alexandrium_andersonii.AAC.1